MKQKIKHNNKLNTTKTIQQKHTIKLNNKNWRNVRRHKTTVEVCQCNWWLLNWMEGYLYYQCYITSGFTRISGITVLYPKSTYARPSCSLAGSQTQEQAQCPTFGNSVAEKKVFNLISCIYYILDNCSYSPNSCLPSTVLVFLLFWLSTLWLTPLLKHHLHDVYWNIWSLRPEHLIFFIHTSF